MKTILLIEDDVVLRDCTVELLELSNYKVLKASNGKIGVKLAKQYVPDIIVCDIMMPELDGYGVLKALSKDKTTKYIPFIFLSAKTEFNDVRKGMNLGADDYISKPFAIKDLIDAIESRLAKVAILQELATNENDSKEDMEHEIKTLNDLKNFFDDNGTVFTFNKDDVIYREGDHANFIYLINKGAVKCHQIQEQGKELVTALYKEDDLFGYTSFTKNIPHQETVTAIEDVELTGVSTIEFNKILNNNHKLALELMQLLSEDLISTKSQLLEKAYASVNKKTAATILKFVEKINKKPEDPIKISRTDLANVAGIATETLIRALAEFKKDGIITTEGRNIKVVDIEKLKNIN
ncbi:CRP-like cAMP-binding protein [Mariniflexile fucanivorans]|uniref:CRP-like cAMP-binding protein n=1 Tax=Mariniflexile fucanivorans TaxID=264023 RepID=A0A4R1RHQ0_9FLAO|nr:response regulator [Mariniflexile fucanivorans]TCL65591.1 CRP-like cAMP-binding protein [Mariniflexile fucanivorans]